MSSKTSKPSKTDRILKLLADGVSVKDVARRVQTTPNYVYFVSWRDKNKKSKKVMKKPAAAKKAKKAKRTNGEKEYVVNLALPYSADDALKAELKRMDEELLARRAVDEAELVQAIEDDINSRPSTVDNVNHPPHYTAGGIETIDFIEAKNLNYNRGNALKYLTRAGVKNGDTEIEDLQKSVWYLQREISKLQTSV